MSKIQQVKRVTLTSGVNSIEFKYVCGKWLVKNFSDNDVFVSFDDNFTEDNAMKIPAGYFQMCVVNEYLGGLETYKKNIIYIKGTGEIEVQQLCFH